MNEIDVVTQIQAWIIANETIAAEHHAQLVEDMVHDHIQDFAEEVGKIESERRSGRRLTALPLGREPSV